MMRFSKSITLLLAMFCVALLMRPIAVAAQTDTAGIALSARAGFDGFYKNGDWVPVQVTVSNSGPAVTGEIRLNLGAPFGSDAVVYSAPIELPTQSNKRVTIYADVPRIFGDPVVELLDENGRLVAAVDTNRLSQLAVDNLLYAVVSPDPGELEFLEDVTGSRSRAAVAFLALAELPDVAPAWNSLDVLVVNDIDTGQLSPQQLTALQQWVGLGGQLVVTGGPGWQKTAASLADLLPVSISGSETVDDLPALSSAAGIPFRDPGPYLVTTSSLRSGEMLFHQEGLPLLARQPLGRGQVYFMALDPKLAPLLDWDGNEPVWATVANDVPRLPYWAHGFRSSYTAGTAVSSLASLTLPSVLTLVVFLLIYVIVLGPGNYILLKRIGRRELAWASVPVLVFLFSGLAYFTGFQLKGNEVIVNQMSLVYGRIGGEPTRIQSLVGLYSPRRSTYDLTFASGTLAHPFDRDSGDMSGAGNLDAVTMGTELTMDNVRVDVSAVETFVADSYGTGPEIFGQATLDQSGNRIMLNATVRNDGDFALEHATLLLGGRAFAVGTLLPGEEKSVTEAVGSSRSSNSGTVIAAPGAPVYVPHIGTNSPLRDNAHLLLGTSNYYEDREVYPRWQMLEAVDNYYYGTGIVNNVIPNDAVTLVAWSDQPQVSARLNRESYQNISTSLYLLEIPLQQNLVGGSNISLPISLLEWEVLDTENIYDPSIENLYLSSSSVEFEYRPWSNFRDMAVTGLSIALTPQDENTSQPLPQLRLWHWQDERWLTVPDAEWGVMKINDYSHFVGPANAVRLRLSSADSFGIEIREVYPVYTGDME